MNSHDTIAKKSRALFEHSVATLDTATTNRLRLMRRDSLAQHSPSRLRAFLLPATASLAIVVGVLVFFTPMQAGNSVTEQDTIYISAEDDADIDMVNWLADAPIAIPSHIQGAL